MERLRSSLNLLVVSPYVLKRDGAAGVVRYNLELIKPLQDKGCRVTMLAPHTDEPKATRHHELGREIFTLKQSNTQFELSASLNIERAEAIERKIQPDVIDVNDPMANPFGTHTLYLASPIKGDGKPVPLFVATKHAQIERLTLAGRGFDFLEKVLRGPLVVPFRMPSQGFKKAFGEIFEDRNVFISEATQKSSHKIYGKYSQAGEVICNGISTDELLEASGKRERREDDKKIVIVMPGRHDPRKGFDDGFEAYKKLIPWFRENNLDVELVITAPDGQETEKYKEFVRINNLPNVIFANASKREDYLKVLANADIGLALSTGGEGWNRVIAEMRVMGLKVIATNIPGHTESYGNPAVFGRMANPHDPSDVACLIVENIKLAKEEKDRRVMSGKLFVVNNFDVNIIAGKKVALYEKYLIEHRKPTGYDWETSMRRPHVTDIFTKLSLA